MTVTTCSVLKHFNVIEHIGLGHVAGFVDPFAEAFLLQAAEKRHGHGIVQQFPDDSCWALAGETRQKRFHS